MALKLITAPAVEPLTVADAVTLAHLRVDSSELNAAIALYIAAARRQAEHITERALITQTWELALDAYPAAEIRLPRPNLLSIVSVKYDDVNQVEQTLLNTAYTADTYSQPGWVLPAYGTAWPTALAAANSVRIRYTCGYGPTAADVPEGIRQWMLLQVRNMVDNPGAMVNNRLLVPPHVERLLDAYRVWVL